MKTKYLFGTLVSLLILSGTLLAQPSMDKAPNNRKKDMLRGSEGKGHMGMNLTEDQKTKMKDLHLALYKEVQPLRNQLNELRAKSRTLETAENADIKAINANIDKMTDLESQIRKAEAANKQKIRALLTVDQRIIFDSQKPKNGRQSFAKGPRNQRFSNMGRFGRPQFGRGMMPQHMPPKDTPQTENVEK